MVYFALFTCNGNTDSKCNHSIRYSGSNCNKMPRIFLRIQIQRTGFHHAFIVTISFPVKNIYMRKRWGGNMNIKMFFRQKLSLKQNRALVHFRINTRLGIPGYFVHFFIEVKLAYDLEESLLKLFFIFYHAI